MMCSDWLKTTLADISTDISYGYTERASEQKIGPHFLRITDIQDGVVDWKTVPYCPITEAARERYKLIDGDIVVARTGNSTGENYIFEGGHDAVFASYLIRFRIDPEFADPRYVWYNLRSPAWWNFIKISKTGSAQAGANARVLGRFPISLPSISQQRAIVDILGGLDAKIEFNRKQSVALESVTEALFKAWFIDFDPVRAKSTGRWESGQSLTGLPADTHHLFPNRLVWSDIGELPEGWKVSTIGSEFTVTMGQSPPGETYNVTGEGLPFYQGRTDFTFRYPVRRVFCTAPKRTANPGDTLVSVRAPVGDINMALETSAIGRGVAAVRHKDGYQSFTYQVIKSISKTFARFNAEGTIFGSIGRKDFEKIHYVSPPETLIAAFEKIASNIDNQIERIEHEMRTLVQLRETLIPVLVSENLQIQKVGALAKGKIL